MGMLFVFQLLFVQYFVTYCSSVVAPKVQKSRVQMFYPLAHYHNLPPLILNDFILKN